MYRIRHDYEFFPNQSMNKSCLLDETYPDRETAMEAAREKARSHVAASMIPNSPSNDTVYKAEDGYYCQHGMGAVIDRYTVESEE